MPSTIAYLTKPGTEVQHYYLVTFVRMLCRHQVMRMHTIAYALFPNRTQSAAMTAAQRVVSNARKKGYITHVNWMNGRRYYALTSKGARFLNELNEEEGAHSTVPALRKQNKDHREWGTLIAIASEQRGMSGLGEAEIAGSMYADLTKYFAHIPDAVTLVNRGNVRHALWHEVETSRRSTTRRTTTPKESCGAEKFAHLVETLRNKFYLTHAGEEWRLTLILHCGSAKIERELRGLLVGAGGTPEGDGYTFPFSRRTPTPELLAVVINQLPGEHENAWTGVLPWRGCDLEPKSPIDRFVHRPARGEPPAENPVGQGTRD